MPIKVECEICGAKYKVGDHRAGRRIPCKECGADMRVPGGGRGGAGRGASGATVPLARTRHRSVEDDDEYLEDAGDSSARLWMALGVGLVAAIGVIIAVIVSLSGGDDGPGDAVAQNDQAAAAANNPINNSTPRPTPHVPPRLPGRQNP